MSWWSKATGVFTREPRYSLTEVAIVYDMAFDKATAMYAEARKANMVEQGLLPQDHLSRADQLLNRQHLETQGHANLGRSVAEGHFKPDPDLTARDE